MSTSVASSMKKNSSSSATLNYEYIQTLINENEQLKLLNEKLYKRTLNQKRKLLRLKKRLSETNMTDEQSNIINETENMIEPDNINDNVWEDVEEVMASYNIEK